MDDECVSDPTNWSPVCDEIPLIPIDSQLLHAPPGDSLQLPGIPSNAAFENALPTFVISGFQQLGPPSNANADFRTDVTQILGALSVQRGYIREGMNLEFRTEVFNLANTPPLGAPNTTSGTPGFGSITSAGDPRVVQLGFKLNF